MRKYFNLENFAFLKRKYKKPFPFALMFIFPLKKCERKYKKFLIFRLFEFSPEI